MSQYHFCTYFDKNYLYKGLALHRSLLQHIKQFTLWILCIDEVTFNVLQKMNLENVRLIPLEYLEQGDEALLEAKRNRNLKEYCWTLTPSLPLYILKKYTEIDSIAYLDADLLFFSNPEPVYEEFRGHSVLIIEHRHAPTHAHLAQVSGIHNVGMLIFKNDAGGLETLNWWRDRCNKWCFARVENGKFGDQKYLDDWPLRFRWVVVSKHKGAGLAPWNIANYTLQKVNNKIRVDTDDLIFYHYHGAVLRSERILDPSAVGYRFTRQQVELIYRPYLKILRDIMRIVKQTEPGFEYGINRLGVFRMFRKLVMGQICFEDRPHQNISVF